MIYELRTYVIPAGRMPDILERFENVTMDLFARHGFDVVGFWTVTDSDPVRELVYLLRWASAEAMATTWQSFRDDPDWVATRKRTEANGPIVEEIVEKTMVATSFSPMR